MDTLVVIGNGFDIHHGIKSKLTDFKKFSVEQGSRWVEYFEKHNTELEKETWNNFESVIGRLDPESISESMLEISSSIGDDSFFKSITGKEYLLNDLREMLGPILDCNFYHWLLSLKIPVEQQLELPPFDETLYISFNYTETLQSLYGVPEECVLHIHGKRCDESSIVLGHADEEQYFPPIDLEDGYSFNFAEGDTDFEGINDLALEMFEDRHKPSEEIISENQEYFNKLSECSKIFVLGHSLADVDIPYFLKIKNSIPTSAIWRVSYYNEGERDDHEEALELIGIPPEKYLLSSLSEVFV